MAALRAVSLRFLQRPAPVLAGHAGFRRHLSGSWNMTSSRIPREAKMGWWVPPSGLLFLFAAGPLDWQYCPVICEASAEPGPRHGFPRRVGGSSSDDGTRECSANRGQEGDLRTDEKTGHRAARTFKREYDVNKDGDISKEEYFCLLMSSA